MMPFLGRPARKPRTVCGAQLIASAICGPQRGAKGEHGVGDIGNDLALGLSVPGVGVGLCSPSEPVCGLAAPAGWRPQAVLRP